MADYLPFQLRKQFLVTLADYLNKIYKYMDKIQEEDAMEAGARHAEFKEKVASFSRKYIAEILSYHLFEAIPKLNEYFREYQVLQSLL